MKRFLQFFLSLMAFCTVTSVASAAVHDAVGLHPAITAISMAVLTVYHVATRQVAPGVFTMGIDVEFWVNYIIQRLRRDNQFLSHFFDESQYVVGGSIVHIPQPGSAPTVVKNRSSYPAAAVRRTDTDITYVLDEYTTDPSHIVDAEKVQLSYDKINDILGDHMDTLTATVGDDLILKILALLPSTNIVSTTGGAATAWSTGTTGNRKVMLKEDLKSVALKMNLANLPKQDRYALLESNMLDQLTSNLDATAYRSFTESYDAANNIVGKLYGFNIMERSHVATAATALNGSSQLVVTALGAAVGATDDCISVCWQKNAVAAAQGDVKFFEDRNNPLYYGDIYSSLTRMGARRRRSDNAGVIAIKAAV